MRVCVGFAVCECPPRVRSYSFAAVRVCSLLSIVGVAVVTAVVVRMSVVRVRSLM